MYLIITRAIETCTESPTQMLVFWHIHLARPLTTQHPPLETTIAKSKKIFVCSLCTTQQRSCDTINNCVVTEPLPV